MGNIIYVSCVNYVLVFVKPHEKHTNAFLLMLILQMFFDASAKRTN